MTKIEEKAINTIRFLAVDAIQKANSGHPGMPMGCAPIAFLLYSKIMKHNPKNPGWINRDRFVLSAGHGSMLLYSILHLTGYGITLDDLKNFRQWGSITPGHPEYGHTPGVETTTGPLGQGFSNAVGMALAEKHLGAIFNKEDIQLLDHFIYVIAGDGDLMEGVTHETASFAGHNKLDSLIVFYDNNKITIDGKTDLAMSEDVAKRFEAYNWHVQHVEDVNNLEALETAIKIAKAEKGKPSLIITDTHIGYGSPHKQDTASVHGSPLGEEEVRLTKKNLGWDEDKTFYIPDDVKEFFDSLSPVYESYENVWQSKFDAYKSKYPEEAAEFERIFNGELPQIEWEEFSNYGESEATRSASGKVLNKIAEFLPELFGGSADLHPSNNTYLKNYKDFSGNNFAGRNIHFGIREHGMASMMNGMAYYGGIIPYGGTFLVFSDYLRPTLRIAAMSGLRTIFVFTHDSIGLGEDGPTHQPVEHISSLRAIPGVIVIRPADSNDTVYAWKTAIETKHNPVALILSRQKLPVLDRNKYAPAKNALYGAYVIKKEKGEKTDLLIIASGSEVSLALQAAEALEAENKSVRVVNMVSWEIFEKQSNEYKESVLPKEIKNRLVIEAATSFGWEKYAGCEGKIISVEKYGASAPAKTLFEKYGFSVSNVVKVAKEMLES